MRDCGEDKGWALAEAEEEEGATVGVGVGGGGVSEGGRVGNVWETLGGF